MSNFYTDTIKNSPKFTSTDRISDVQLLAPKTRALVDKIIADAKAHGFALMVSETYRSQAGQSLLFAERARKLQHEGAHHYRLACDVAKCINGQPACARDFSIL